MHRTPVYVFIGLQRGGIISVKFPKIPGRFQTIPESFQRFATLRTSQTKYTLQGCEYDYVYANVRVIYLFILYIVLKDPH